MTRSRSKIEWARRSRLRPWGETPNMWSNAVSTRPFWTLNMLYSFIYLWDLLWKPLLFEIAFLHQCPLPSNHRLVMFDDLTAINELPIKFLFHWTTRYDTCIVFNQILIVDSYVSSYWLIFARLSNCANLNGKFTDGCSLAELIQAHSMNCLWLFNEENCFCCFGRKYEASTAHAQHALPWDTFCH